VVRFMARGFVLGFVSFGDLGSLSSSIESIDLTYVGFNKRRICETFNSSHYIGTPDRL
jgi:hypothetical protein